MKTGLLAAAAAAALLSLPSSAVADLASLTAACAPKDGVVFCDDGVPSAGGRSPNPGAVKAIPVPAAYQGFEGLPAKDPVAAAAVPGNAAGDVAIDADLTLPAGPAPAGGRPLIVFMHGCCSGNKTDYDTTRRAGGDAEKLTPSSELWHYNNVWFARRGYAVLTYTSRGFVTTTGSGEQGSTGETQLDHRAFEINDLQHLVGQLVDEPSLGIDPARIVPVGGSYGGGFGWMALTDPRWKSPGGRDVRLAAVITKYGWTDLAYSLVPTGKHVPGMLPPPDGSATASPLGLVKRSFTAALFASGVGGLPGTSGRHATFTPSITEALACLNANDPSTASTCPGLQATLRAFIEDRSSYYQNAFFDRLASDSSLATPVFVGGTFSDQLFPAEETLRMVQRLQAARPGLPIQQYFGDYLHATQNKAKEWADLCGADRHVCRAGETDVVERGVNSRVNDFLDHFARPEANPAAPKPPLDVTASLYVCKTNAGPGQPLDAPGTRFSAATFEGLAPERLSLRFTDPQSTRNAVSDEHAVQADPVTNAAVNANSCPNHTTAPANGVAAWQSAPLDAPRTMLGTGRVTYEYTATTSDPSSLQLNTRLYDVAPDGRATLVDRGVRRLDGLQGPVTYALHGQGWRFERGHAIRIEATQDDDPYVRRSSTPSTMRISSAAVELPVRAGDGGAVPAAGGVSCRPRGGVEQADAFGRGSALRLRIPASAGRVTVDIFQQTEGRLVIGERRVARLRRSGRSTWAARGLPGGVYMVRFRDARGRTGRVAVERRGGRFRALRDYAIAPGCTDLARFKLERPAFGGLRNRALGIALRLGTEGRVRVSVLRRGKLVRRFTERTAPARRLVRFRLASEGVPRGTIVVRLSVRIGDRTVTRELRSRRL